MYTAANLRPVTWLLGDHVSSVPPFVPPFISLIHQISFNHSWPIVLCGANIVVIGTNVYMYDREVALGLHVGVSQFCLLPLGVESVLDEPELDLAGSRYAFCCLK